MATTTKRVKKMKVLLMSALLSTNVLAADMERWDSVEVSHQSITDGEFKAKAVGLSVSKLVTNKVFITGQFSKLTHKSDELEGLKVTGNSFGLGLGYRVTASESTDLFATIGHTKESAKATYMGYSMSETFNSNNLSLGSRTMINDSIEVITTLHALDFTGETTIGFGVKGLIDISDDFSVGLGFNKAESSQSVSASAVFFF